MKEQITFIMVEQGLQLKFKTITEKSAFIKDMKEIGIEFFTEGSDTACDVKLYSEEQPYGVFLSKERRVGLNFPSEKHKFLFKERTGLDSRSFMDMGLGYDSQMHFHERALPARPGAFIIATREMEEAPQSSFPLK